MKINHKIITKALTIITAMSLMIAVLPATGFFLESPEETFVVNAATQDGVYRKLISLQQKFPDGKYWNHIVPASEAGVNCSNEAYADSVSDTPCAIHKGNVGAGYYDCSFFDGGLQCCGFARKVFYDVFGIRESTLQANIVYGSSGLSVGDFVSFNGNEHYAVVLSISGSTITVVECNLDGLGAQYNCMISWGRTYQFSQIKYYVHSPNYDSVNKVCSSHKWDSGKVTKKAKHTKTELVNGEKTYTCTVCGETKTETLSVSHSFKTSKTIAATLKKNGRIKKECSKCGKTTSDPIYRPKVIRLKKPNAVYTGKAIKPGVIVRDAKGNSVAKKYYSVSYKNNQKLGTATAIVKFNGKYSGTKKLSFKIVPKGTKLIKCTGGSKCVSVTWKKTKGIDGYQIQYATRENFSNKKELKVKGNKKFSRVIKKLSAGTTYYVRVRTYKTVNKQKHYSLWSNVLSAKTNVVTKRTKAMNAYKKLLKQKEKEYERFSLYDIDNNGIPELFTYGGGSWDYTKIYTYDSGLKKVRSSTGFWLYSNGIIRANYHNGDGCDVTSFYDSNWNLLYRYADWYMYYWDLYDDIYGANGGPYTEGEKADSIDYYDNPNKVEYEDIMFAEDELVGDARQIYPKNYKNTAKNRTKYLK